ncbi:CAP domain-containing protein [uncultured Cohaesibacter sp.]|uniref:CAP domain-containing protein n=1 Tax=uncultured Cohaesibacter sp. TaxID=1002546 RepID=UPI0029C6DE60|nr:CAP domain-containing protein [uncultured Cohaesibacter sp.]
MLPKTKIYPVVAAMLTLLLSSCSQGPDMSSPAMYTNLGQGGVSVDPQEALTILNAYRQKNGLSTLTLSDKLNAAAQEEADAMAKAVKVSHALTPDLTLIKRLERAGYQPVLATENIGAGYYSLAEAFSGWRDSSRHNENMLKPGMTQMGIATQYRGDAKYKVFWSLILAKPDETPAQPTPAGMPPQTRPSALFAQ